NVPFFPEKCLRMAPNHREDLHLALFFVLSGYLVRLFAPPHGDPMARWLFVAFLIGGFLPVSAQQSSVAGSDSSCWRLEFQMLTGTARVLDIEDIPQPTVGTASQSGGFLLGLEYRLGDNWSLYSGVHVMFRQG